MATGGVAIEGGLGLGFIGNTKGHELSRMSVACKVNVQCVSFCDGSDPTFLPARASARKSPAFLIMFRSRCLMEEFL